MKQARGAKAGAKKKSTAIAKRGVGMALDVDQARLLLARTHDVEKILDIKDGAKLAVEYRRVSGAGRDSMNDALEIVLRAQRRFGEFLVENGLGKGRPKNAEASTFSLGRLEIERHEALRCRKLAKSDEQKFEDHIITVRSKGDRLTMSGALAAISDEPTYKSDEWYTPANYVELVRDVLGSIDLDPASSLKAQTVVGATLWYGKAEDGLAHDWAGRVFLNPPYSNPAPFVAKLLEALGTGDVPEAIVLTNNTTDTEWAQSLLDASAAVCFTRGRIAFDQVDKEGRRTEIPNTRQGQIFFYLGNDADSFVEAFEEFNFDADKEPIRNAILRPSAPLYVPAEAEESDAEAAQ